MVADIPHTLRVVYQRTQAGQAEVLRRHQDLGDLHRKLLASVTGLTPLHHLLQLLDALDHGPHAAHDLVRLGLIAPCR